MADHREPLGASDLDDRSASAGAADAAGAAEPVDLGMFALSGEVDGVLVWAAWTAAGGLECSPALLDRARAVVALGETFAGHRGGARRAATLGGPSTTTLLTLMRACSTVFSVEVGYD